MNFHFNSIFEIHRFLQLEVVFNMGNRRNRCTRRNESQSPERDENMSETRLLQGDATLTIVSENVNNVFDRNLGSELTEPSQISNEIEIISQRLSEQNSNKMTQIEHQLNSKLEEILKEIRANKNCNTTTDEEDVESRQPGPSNSKPKGLRSKHASNMTIERDQDDRFYSSEMSELRQPYTPIRITNETLDETIITNENRQESADHHKYNSSNETISIVNTKTMFSYKEKSQNKQNNKSAWGNTWPNAKFQRTTQMGIK